MSWLLSEPSRTENNASAFKHLGLREDSSNRDRDADLGDFQALMQHSKAVLKDSSLDFLLLHLPVPHSPGLYNRVTKQVPAVNSTYLDNLALADLCLACFKSILAAKGE